MSTKEYYKQLRDNAPNVPRAGNVFTRWLGRSILKVLGWRIVGELPNVKHVVVAAAPHTSNWDFIFAMSSIMAVGVKLSYLMKKEAFFWPFKSLFMSLGGIPIDRDASKDRVGQITQWYEKNEKVWVAITPEGTRSKVDTWKTGFLRIAEQAHVPVFLIGFDYQKKHVVLDRIWPTTGNNVNDAELIRRYMTSHYHGRNKSLQ